MLERTRLNDKMEMLVFDEDIPEFQEILDIAKNDTGHPLHSNYSNLRVSDFLFVTLFLYDNNPAIFYGLQQKSWMGPTAARAYTRAYKSPEYRQQKYHLAFRPMLTKGGYDSIEHWWKPRGINTLLTTRNVSDKPDGFVTMFDRYSPVPWHRYPYVCNINGVDQYVMWTGESSLDFLKPLRSYQIIE